MAKKEEVKENVITINGQEFTEKSLEPNSKYFLTQIRDLQTQRNQLKFQMDQKQAAIDMMTLRLTESVKVEETEEEVEKAS
jgi:dihydroorotase